jgi:hypothetical protein
MLKECPPALNETLAGINTVQEMLARGEADTGAILTMWQDYPSALKYYEGHLTGNDLFVATTEMPYWMGDERVHASHRHALVVKYPEMRSYWPMEPDVPLHWPEPSGEWQEEFDLASEED